MEEGSREAFFSFMLHLLLLIRISPPRINKIALKVPFREVRNRSRASILSRVKKCHSYKILIHQFFLANQMLELVVTSKLSVTREWKPLVFHSQANHLTCLYYTFLMINELFGQDIPLYICQVSTTVLGARETMVRIVYPQEANILTEKVLNT